MKRFWLIAALFLMGCTSFEHGVVEQPFPNDDKLIGTWMVHGDKEDGYLRFAAAGPSSLRVEMFDADCKTDKSQPITLLRTEIAGTSYLQVAERAPPYIFFAYHWDADGSLRPVGLDMSVVEQAVRDGQLAGHVQKPVEKAILQSSMVVVEAETTQLRAFLAAHPELIKDAPVSFRAADQACSAPS